MREKKEIWEGKEKAGTEKVKGPMKVLPPQLLNPVDAMFTVD